jgi:hypothetical protein
MQLKYKIAIGIAIILILLIIFIIYNWDQMKGYPKEIYDENIKKFVKYDGCSGGMSMLWKLFGKTPEWEHCCDDHDQPYFKGGTYEEKKKADKELKQCVEKTGNKFWANVMYPLVQVGGSPKLPFSWRWGFGKKYYTGYTK